MSAPITASTPLTATLTAHEWQRVIYGLGLAKALAARLGSPDVYDELDLLRGVLLAQLNPTGFAEAVQEVSR